MEESRKMGLVGSAKPSGLLFASAKGPKQGGFRV